VTLEDRQKSLHVASCNYNDLDALITAERCMLQLCSWVVTR